MHDAVAKLSETVVHVVSPYGNGKDVIRLEAGEYADFMASIIKELSYIGAL